MLVGVIVAVMLADSAVNAARVSIYVGAEVRNGYADIDKGVSDSIKEIKKELRKNAAFAVVDDESAAVLKLYVRPRTTVATGGSTVVGSGSATTTGSSTQGTSAVTSVPDKVNRLEAVLRVESYERTFAGESDWMVGAWKRCARTIVGDLSTWVDANRPRLAEED